MEQEFDKFLDVHTSVWYNYLICRFAFILIVRIFNYILMCIITFGLVIFKDRKSITHFIKVIWIEEINSELGEIQSQ